MLPWRSPTTRATAAPFADPKFNGPAEVVLEVDGGDGKESIPANDFGITNVNIQPPVSGEVIDGISRKVYIKDVPVSIINETVKYYDADGKLITESIVEYSSKNLKNLYKDYEDFKREWCDSKSKKDFINKIYNEGVMV